MTFPPDPAGPMRPDDARARLGFAPLQTAPPDQPPALDSRHLEAAHRELDRAGIPREDPSLRLPLTAAGRIRLALTGATRPPDPTARSASLGHSPMDRAIARPHGMRAISFEDIRLIVAAAEALLADLRAALPDDVADALFQRNLAAVHRPDLDRLRDVVAGAARAVEPRLGNPQPPAGQAPPASLIGFDVADPEGDR